MLELEFSPALGVCQPKQRNYFISEVIERRNLQHIQNIDILRNQVISFIPIEEVNRCKHTV